MRLEKLYEKLEDYLSRGVDVKTLVEKINYIEESLFEDTSATGGPSGASTGGAVSGGGGTPMANAAISGMGDVVNSQPASLPGVLNGSSFDGTIGSGDISIPYNALGKKTHHTMGKSHGSLTGKKSRKKPLDINKLKMDLKSFKDRKGSGKIKTFKDFDKDSVDRVNKVNDIK